MTASSIVASGADVWYLGRGGWVAAAVHAVHHDDPTAPYYAIKLADGSVRDTERERLAPRTSAKVKGTGKHSKSISAITCAARAAAD